MTGHCLRASAMQLWVWFRTLRLPVRRWPPLVCSKVKALALRRQLVRLRAQALCNIRQLLRRKWILRQKSSMARGPHG